MDQQKIFDVYNRAVSRAACEHPEAPSNCTKRIVDAHTVQRSRVLAGIAESGHVMSLRPKLGFVVKNGMFIPQKLGVREASTFPGFCEHHDKATFASIEDHPIVPTKAQAFLLGYRALVSEMRFKEALLQINEKLAGADAGTSIDAQLQYQATTVATSALTNTGLQELDSLRTVCDAALVTGDYAEFRFYVQEFASPPFVVSSAVITPEYGFTTARLQDWRDFSVRMQGVFLNVLPISSGTLVVWGWHSQDARIGDAIKTGLSSIEPDRVSDAVVRFVLANADNVYLQPSWWNGLDTVRQQMIGDLARASVDREARPWDHLPNRRALATWPLVRSIDL